MATKKTTKEEETREEPTAATTNKRVPRKAKEITEEPVAQEATPAGKTGKKAPQKAKEIVEEPVVQEATSAAKTGKKAPQKAKEIAEEPVAQEAAPPSLRDKYQKEVIPALTKRFGYRNVMQVPRLVKVVVSRGVGEAIANPKALESSVDELLLVTRQKPLVTKAKKSIASFKLRSGMKIGCLVTLRGQRMYDFVTKLIDVALPRIRDFKGVSPRSFDGRGNFNLGLREQLIFPEIDYDKVDKARGMNVTFVTTAKTDEEARLLLEALGIPFRS
jgi:large subunit ribosomal protein L5